MDFMKVFDQAVREIKREVNLKVLQVPEIEQKVLDATDDEPWGPHGTVLAEIARATEKFECQLVMDVLWTRLAETGKNWRLVYKALAVIEYIVAHGSERAVDDIIEHTYQISSLASFEYVEPSGKDVGINVRKRAETITALLNGNDKIEEVRNKADANRDKYFGLSSSGITFKSGAASFSSSSFMKSDQYGGSGSTGGNETFDNSYKAKDQYGKDKYDNTTKSKKESPPYGSKKQESPVTASKKTSQSDKYPPNHSQNTSLDKYDEDFDDFDPRGTSSAKPSAGNNQVDLFGQNLVGDLLDAPSSVPSIKFTSFDNDPSEVDLFADAAFISAAPEPEAGKNLASQTNVDLFASGPAVSTTMVFFSALDPPSHLDSKACKSDRTSEIADPFAAFPLNNFKGSDTFGTFISHSDPLSNKNSSKEEICKNMNESSIEIRPQLKKEAFQIKSGVWADSLSRGLIDLNITAPKKANLADLDVLGGLSDGSGEKENVPFSSFYTDTFTGIGPDVVGKSGFKSTSTDDFFSSLSNQQEYQFGNFQK